MKQRRFNEEQIIRILKEQEAGVRTGDICRRHGIAESTFYKWKAKFCCFALPFGWRYGCLRRQASQES